MNKKIIIGAIILIVIVFMITTFVSTTNSARNVAIQRTNPQTTGNSQTQIASTTTSQNTEDIVPGLYPNPINNTTTTQGLKISSILVENNTDAAGNPVNDHLQLTIQNLTRKTLSNFEAYYTIVDVANGKKEGYYKQLTGFSLTPHGSGVINFDSKTGQDHYGVNMHGIYGTTVDQLAFSVEISTPGYAPIYANATKAPGGAEVVGQ